MFEATPSTDSYATKVHGRVDCWLQASRLMIVLAMALRHDIGNTALLIVLWCCAVASARAVLQYQPYHKHVVNRGLVAASFVFGWACFCVTLLEARGPTKVHRA